MRCRDGVLETCGPASAQVLPTILALSHLLMQQCEQRSVPSPCLLFPLSWGGGWGVRGGLSCAQKTHQTPSLQGVPENWAGQTECLRGLRPRGLFTCTSRFSRRELGSPAALTRTEDGYIQFMFQKESTTEKERKKEKKSKGKNTQTPPPTPKFPPLVAALKYALGRVGAGSA